MFGVVNSGCEKVNNRTWKVLLDDGAHGHDLRVHHAHSPFLYGSGTFLDRYRDTIQFQNRRFSKKIYNIYGINMLTK